MLERDPAQQSAASAPAALDYNATTRRTFIAEALGLAACAAPLSIAPATSAAAEPNAAITPATIAEAEKLHDVRFTPAQRAELASAVVSQVSLLGDVRRIARPLALQP